MVLQFKYTEFKVKKYFTFLCLLLVKFICSIYIILHSIITNATAAKANK